MRCGAHVNAHTSFDETVYELQIPTGNPAVMDRSLTILEDFAHSVSFDEVEIDKERGVILEEWRLGLGAGERIRDAQMPVLLKGSRYAERSPIGKPEIIRNVSYDRLKQFYTDWYRPEHGKITHLSDGTETRKCLDSESLTSSSLSSLVIARRSRNRFDGLCSLTEPPRFLASRNIERSTPSPALSTYDKPARFNMTCLRPRVMRLSTVTFSSSSPSPSPSRPPRSSATTESTERS